jgi:hypothetical protein
VLAIVANRVIAPPRDRDALAAIEKATDELDGAALAMEAARLVADLSGEQAPHLERLRSLGPPTAEIPLIGFAGHDLAATRSIADALESAS